jgi:DNA-directed RNA polymerase specialized sigma54-like protein
VADAIGMHESTVSRVTANKYMLTLARRFRAALLFHRLDRLTGYGDAHSSEAVRDRIKQMIDEERPRRAFRRCDRGAAEKVASTSPGAPSPNIAKA